MPIGICYRSVICLFVCLSACLSVSLCVTFVHSAQTTEDIDTISFAHDGPVTALRDACCHPPNVILQQYISCVLCRMWLWAERCRILPNYFDLVILSVCKQQLFRFDETKNVWRSINSHSTIICMQNWLQPTRFKTIFQHGVRCHRDKVTPTSIVQSFLRGVEQKP